MAKKKNRMIDKTQLDDNELDNLPTDEEVVTQPTEELPPVAEEVEVPQPVEELQPVVEEVQPTRGNTKTTQVVDESPLLSKKDHGAMLMHKIEFELNNFAEAMDPKRSITKEEAAQWHMSLFLLIKRVLNTPEQADFNIEWGTLLGYINKNRDGVYSENWIFRHTDAWSGSGAEFNQYRRLIVLILNTANPKTRKAEMANINFERLVEGLKQAPVNRLGAFYSV